MQERQQVRVLGITGGVGAGKSTILNYLREKYHAEVIECDAAARELQEPGAVCYKPMIELFGRDVLLENGQFDRKKIASLIFGDERLLKKLNEIVHPAVKRYVTEAIEAAGKLPQAEEEPWREKDGTSLIVIEAALLLEDRYDLLCDEIWYIHTSEPVRRQRLKASRGYSDEKITRMIQAQQPDEFFRKHCQFTVDNSSDNVENTYEQIDKGLKEHGIL